ncbi:MAG TPA: hypothetical protein VJL39_02900, partial [Candidatus Paceibacterota bacterium]
MQARFSAVCLKKRSLKVQHEHNECDTVIIIEPVVAPPISMFIEIVSRKLRLAGRKPLVRASEYGACMMTFNNVEEIVLHVLSTTEKLSAGAELGGYVFPTVVEIVDDAGGYVCDNHVVFYGIRSRLGREWMYTRFLGAGPVPSGLVDEISVAMTTVLGNRDSLGADVSNDEFETAR